MIRRTGRGTMRTDYPAKVLLAWAEAIRGHAPLRDWLMKNGYPELGVFVFALHLKDDARDWLMKNGHAHLMAVITAIEGNKTALSWLEHHGMAVLKQVALAGDGDEEAVRWLIARGHKELARAALNMHEVKQRIEDDHHDPHKYAQD
ncbi:MAG: hypothetical protein JST41_06585 [Bacteroidetes bacterium]|nr:hypothetical protein [Bacteroidota bacterium]MBX7128915.1 hypothetical protein [Flavobacteriales bacterium]MCC6654059.1 hypothetical protein [Flavobacteriales bacterium]HMU15355.1 hypothetical protein [Flavobacteriales bacterium]HMZ48156.1 hypothetical protein [Flavobacteriales bacterium]